MLTTFYFNLERMKIKIKSLELLNMIFEKSSDLQAKYERLAKLVVIARLELSARPVRVNLIFIKDN